MWDSTFRGRTASSVLLLTLALGGCNRIGEDLPPAGENLLGAPSGLSASALPGGMQVKLSWSDNSTGETGFRIDVNDAPFGTTPTVVNVIEVPAGTTMHVYDTRPGRTLYFRVVAVTADMESEPSNIVLLTIPNVPLPPSGLRAVAVSPSRIDLSWEDVSGETGYRVERSVDAGNTWSALGECGAGVVSYGDTGLAPDTEFWYRVVAFNAEGESLPSATASAVTQTAAMTIRTAASGGNVGMWPSIGLGGGIEYISHYDVANGNCVLTSGTPSGAYNTSVLDAGPQGREDVGWGTALAVDTAGYCHVASYDRTNADLRYVTNYPGPQYLAATVDSAGSVGAFPRIAVSPVDGSIHVLYLVNLQGPDQLRHAVRRYGVWSFEDILPAPYWLASFGLAVDGSGRPHVAMSRSADGGVYELVHGVKTGNSWSFTTITSRDRPQDCSIAVASGGGLHVAYAAGGTACRLMHAEEVGGTWITEVVHEGPYVGRSNSIAIHRSSGRVHVAYYDELNRDLRYARRDPGGAWVLRLIDSGGDVGGYTSLAVEDSGIVHIAYRDETNGDLKVAAGSP